MATVAALGLVLTACGGGEPDVNWSSIPSNQHVAIQDAVNARDCARMQTAFDHSEAADVLSYLDWHMRDAGCY